MGFDDIKTTTVKQLMETFQGGRGVEETVMRMNPEGFARQEDFDSNVERLFAFIGKNKADYSLVCVYPGTNRKGKPLQIR